jgi:hypothetical protein
MALWRGVGGVVRRLGQAVDSLGKTLQGSYAAVDKGKYFWRTLASLFFRIHTCYPVFAFDASLLWS